LEERCSFHPQIVGHGIHDARFPSKIKLENNLRPDTHACPISQHTPALWLLSTFSHKHGILIAQQRSGGSLKSLHPWRAKVHSRSFSHAVLHAACGTLEQLQHSAMHCVYSWAKVHVLACLASSSTALSMSNLISVLCRKPAQLRMLFRSVIIVCCASGYCTCSEPQHDNLRAAKGTPSQFLNVSACSSEEETKLMKKQMYCTFM